MIGMRVRRMVVAMVMATMVMSVPVTMAVPVIVAVSVVMVMPMAVLMRMVMPMRVITSGCVCGTSSDAFHMVMMAFLAGADLAFKA